MPAIALISAAGIMSIYTATIKRILIFFIILVGLVQFFITSYTNLLSAHALEFNMPIGRIRLFGSPEFTHWPYAPRKENWRISEIIEDIRFYSKDKREILIGLMFDGVGNDYNRETFEYYCRQKGYPFHVVSVTQENFSKLYDEIDFIITESKVKIFSKKGNVEDVLRLETPELKFIGGSSIKFKKYNKRYVLPDRTILNIFKSII